MESLNSLPATPVLQHQRESTPLMRNKPRILTEANTRNINRQLFTGGQTDQNEQLKATDQEQSKTTNEDQKEAEAATLQKELNHSVPFLRYDKSRLLAENILAHFCIKNI